MFRISWLIALISLVSIGTTLASEKNETEIALKLRCNISFSQFDQIDHAVKTVVVTLSELKHRPGRMKLVSQTKNYEFWVMPHLIQTLNEHRFISNFQVAIKEKSSQLFMHALSDSSHIPDQTPKYARISLVDYHPNTTLEKGELSFDCRSIE